MPDQGASTATDAWLHVDYITVHIFEGKHAKLMMTDDVHMNHVGENTILTKKVKSNSPTHAPQVPLASPGGYKLQSGLVERTRSL